MSAGGSADGLDPEIVEALAKRLFRAENPPTLLWDAALLERAGLSPDGYRFADDEAKAAYRTRAAEALAEPGS